jgi:AcrR family transcriptional regulator
MTRPANAAARGGGSNRAPVARRQPAGASEGRREAVEALLDAAERLLVEQGYGAITTRKLAEQAGINPGLVHYYFGSMEEVMVQVLERFTARLTERQRAMYASDRYFPLRHHFEQNVHVRHRLQNYRAGRCMDFDAATPEVIAAAITEGIGRSTSYAPVETDGADRAAALIAELL